MVGACLPAKAGKNENNVTNVWKGFMACKFYGRMKMILCLSFFILAGHINF
jgi:hypothetical protein